MARYRTAVIGCGLIGSRFAQDADRIGIYTHAGAHAASARAELHALCDSDADALAEAGRKWGITRLYADPARMLAECEPEIVSICTPDATHAEILKIVLAAPTVRAVFAEKPLAPDSAAARQVLDDAGGKPVLLNYFRRFTENHRALKKLISSGRIGAVTVVTGLYTKGLVHNGTHWLDLARWLVGEITEVQAFDFLREATPDPVLDLRLTFSNRARGVLSGLSGRDYAVFEMDILGEKGRARLTENGWRIEVSEVVPSDHYTGYRNFGPPQLIAGGMRDATSHALENLIDVLDDPTEALRCSGLDGLKSLLITDAARRSLISKMPEVV